MTEKRIASIDEINKQFKDWFKRNQNYYGDMNTQYVRLYKAFVDAWQRAEDYMPKEPISEFVESRIREIFIEASDKYGKCDEFLFRGETLLTSVWEQYVERELNE